MKYTSTKQIEVEVLHLRLAKGNTLPVHWVLSNIRWSESELCSKHRKALNDLKAVPDILFGPQGRKVVRGPSVSQPHFGCSLGWVPTLSST